LCEFCDGFFCSEWWKENNSEKGNSILRILRRVFLLPPSPKKTDSRKPHSGKMSKRFSKSSKSSKCLGLINDASTFFLPLPLHQDEGDGMTLLRAAQRCLEE
jgi:hypothetical protein